MWKLFAGISLTFCACAIADESPPTASVLVDCCGRMRHGVVAIGGETTGTTITFNRIIWELQLRDNAAREFAKKHHKEPVVVTGKLRKVMGTEAKVRWIVDVDSMSEQDPAKHDEGTKLTIQGTLRAADRRGATNTSQLIIHADNQIWPISVAPDAKLEVKPESLVGETVLMKGSVERISEEDSSSAMRIRFNALKRAP